MFMESGLSSIISCEATRKKQLSFLVNHVTNNI